MTRVEKQPAFVLHARPYRETSLLIEAFTRDFGRVGLVARGVRREKSRLPRGVLQPLQPLLLAWSARGELGMLTGADSVSAPFVLSGDALYAAMYVNELVLRLSGRNDAHGNAFAAYARCLAALAGDGDTGAAWALRRFERDFLAELGYALALTHDAGGAPLQPGVRYAYDPDSGPLPIDAPGRFASIDGAALLALARDEKPTTAGLAQLRGLVRSVIRHLLGGELHAWVLPAAAKAYARGD